MPVYVFECSDPKCGQTREITRSIKSPPRAVQRCTGCKRRTAKRVYSGGAGTHAGDMAKEKLYGMYPVVSNRLPFNMKVPGVDVKHAGPLGKCVIESRAHERKVYDVMGFKRGE